MVRFIGTTGSSSTTRELLCSFIQQLAVTSGQNMEDLPDVSYFDPRLDYDLSIAFEDWLLFTIELVEKKNKKVNRY